MSRRARSASSCVCVRACVCVCARACACLAGAGFGFIQARVLRLQHAKGEGGVERAAPRCGLR